MSFKQSKSVRVKVPHNNFVSTGGEKMKTSHYRNEAKEIVMDYFLTHGYTRSLQMFKIENNKQKRQDESVQEKLLALLVANSRVEFFNRLRKQLGKQIKENEQEFRRLEFFLHLYFLVTTRKERSFDNGAMTAFKGLLQSKGKYLSQIKQFLPYFALPYIQDPSSHPATISHIFKPQWLQSIKTQLTTYLQLHLKQTNQSKLQILLKHNNQRHHTASFQAPSSRQSQLLSIIQQSKQRYKQFQSNYKQMMNLVKQNLIESQTKWFNLTKQLIQITKKFVRVAEQNNLVSGQMTSMIDKIKKYQMFLNNDIDDVISNSLSVSVFDQPTYQDIQNQSVSRLMKRKTSMSMLSLNYEKIKGSLMNEGDVKVCLLLQAMRWRVTRTQSKYGRREIIMGYTINDVFGLKMKGLPILERLFSVESSENIKQQALRLLNSIQSDYQGRSYIVQTSFVLQKIVQTLKTQSYDGIIRRLSLNALQKLTLRPQVQLYCVQHGIITWIVETIRFERQQLSDVSFKYLTAILLNMTLKRIGRTQCAEEQILQLLINLLNIDSSDIKTYVSGSIYSLISSSKISQQAKRINMFKQLNQIKSNSDSQQFIVQLNHIITKIQRNNYQMQESVIDDEDQENDTDDLLKDEEQEEQEEGNEEEQENDIEGADRMDKGEQLLLKRYSCVGPDAIRQQYLTRSILDDAIIKNSLQVSIIKEKKTLRGENNKSTIPARSTLQLIEAIGNKPKTLKENNNQHQPSILIEDYKEERDREEYDSKKYLIKHKNFRKRNLVVKSSLNSEESIQSPNGGQRKY